MFNLPSQFGDSFSVGLATATITLWRTLEWHKPKIKLASWNLIYNDTFIHTNILNYCCHWLIRYTVRCIILFSLKISHIPVGYACTNTAPIWVVAVTEYHNIVDNTLFCTKYTHTARPQFLVLISCWKIKSRLEGNNNEKLKS